MRNLMNSLWEAVQNNTALEGTFQAPSRAVKENHGYMVYITFGSAHDRSVVTGGHDNDFNVAVRKAYEAYYSSEVSERPVSVKVDVVTRISEAGQGGEETKINYRGGRDGIMLHNDPQLLFLPEEVQAYQLLKRGRLRKENLQQAGKKRIPQIGEDALSAAETKLDIIRTTSFYIDDASGYLSLSYGRRKFQTLPMKALESSLELTKDNYFKHAVAENGRIAYAYYPATNKEAEGYNILRHAGTTYSMLELYEWSKDAEILAAAERALEYLTGFAHPHTINGVEVNVIVEEDVIKLGGNGLAIVAFAKYTEVTGSQKYVPLMQSLATWMEELQRDEKRFSVHKQSYSTGEVAEFESKYYPGEAILAMVRLYEVDKQSKWLDYAEKESRYLIEVRDRAADKETIPHDHWLLYGLYDLYRSRPLPLYRGHAFFIADAITEAQLLDPETVSSDMLGSYKIKADYPKSTPAATRSEGLGAAAKLAKLTRDGARAKRYRYSIHQAIKFQLQMQLYPEAVLYFPNKSLSLGGFRASLRGWELRNDYTQHNVSSILSFLQLTNDMKRLEKVSLGLIEDKNEESESYPIPLRTSNRKVFDECLKLGAEWRSLSGEEFELYRGTKSYLIKDGKVLDAMNSALALRCVKRKEVTNALLRSRQHPAPENALFAKGDLKRAWEWAKPLLPVVVKPGGGSKGRSVSVEISTAEDFKEAFNNVLKTDQDILVEKYIEGDIYRFTYIAGEVAAIGKRRPFQVKGDGVSSIHELVEQKNVERRKRQVLGHKELKITSEAEKTLQRAGWKLEDVPVKDEVVYLRRTSHVSAGGEAIDATDEVSTAAKQVIANAIGSIPDLNMCGVDVIIDNDGQPNVLEINNDPNITTHMQPWEGKSIDTVRMLAEAMFPPES